ncbi:MAG: hypothetical protein ACRCWM_10095, partial [Sarcina sp.]
MLVKYKPSATFAKKNLKKYLKISEVKMNPIKKALVLKGVEQIALKVKEREINLGDEGIQILFDEKVFKTIEYSKIIDVVVDEGDIIIVNNIKPLIIPEFAFSTKKNKDEFIKSLEEKRGIIESIDSANSIGRNLILEDTIDIKKYIKYKCLAERNTHKGQVQRGIGIFIFGLLIAFLLSFLAFNSMGAFTNKEFYIGLIIIISVIGAYIFVGIKLLNKRENYYKKNLKSD